MFQFSRRSFVLASLATLAACGKRPTPEASPRTSPYETAEIRRLIDKWADHYEVPRDLVHAQVQRESGYRADARNGPYYGLMQILPETARTMGHRGPASELLDPDVNLKYAVKYLRGAYLVAGGDKQDAMRWYARGYYYEAKRLGLLEETGLRG
ncbi:lytic transglycosylase domain-containing protein [Sinisalibacter aestuarii]|uniref:Lytic transglycosylase n=1 Tax=Sinisalibacter aestuarii TaxID=2949426 RepID=A0ABQ5LWW7_9RHOB|nr:lytic transglycosylase domain-containing protein [Sinisalibacter aestuarii]GKY89475.1 lytic transglycosylase [Sinisalibacter aestuarii]